MRLERSLLGLVLLVGAIGAQRVTANQHEPGAHTHTQAAKLKNPVPADQKSIEEGRQAYATHCAACHGDAGRGDGKQASKLNPKPSNLADAQWKHGPSDGEMFTAIRSGIPKTSMTGFSKKLSEPQTWAVINFLRTLGPR